MEESRSEEERVCAKTVPRASTGRKQEVPLKHRARSAAQASTGSRQDNQVAWRAPPTRTRLLGAPP
jgi:hypothetical protein